VKQVRPEKSRLRESRAALALRAALSAALSAVLSAAFWIGLPAPGSARDARPVPAEVRIGSVLPDVVLKGLNGPSRRLAQYRGWPMLINVWASWCGPCVEEMASLERLAWREDRVPFVLIGISTDDYPDRALAFLNRANATISHFIDRDLQMESLLGASKIPLTVLVDAHGRVVDKIYGARQWDSPESMQRIARALGPKKTGGSP
jgi:thiol-disulfide isomerase/thioredoxin